MEPRYLRQLAEIVELGSLSRAAEALHLTQPTLSRNMKSLEAQVGAPLLKRGRYGVAPTVIGAALARQGRLIRDAMDQAEGEVERWRQGQDGKLRIAVGAMLARSIMPGFVSHILRSKWNVGLRVSVDGAERLLDRLRRDELDIVLAPGLRHFAADDLIHDVMFEDHIGLFASEKHPLAQRREVSVADLAAATWTTVGVLSGARDTTREILSRIGVDGARTVIEFSGDISIALTLVSSGNYLMAAPSFLMRHIDDPRRFVELRFKAEMPRRDVAMWRRQDMKDHPLIDEFKARFETYVRGLADSKPD
ncbi:LysR family transcriptional regulator [Methylocella sp. CPCC 101449]|jgi:DNA-binding transcriptional LysR family regulator|uniref:LysR family transcriptional regulator n=1 Tax=Methylocella sp. CPCC 101449 TaxID=2987531 RepID=UPI00288E1CEE|nr:LysR family transcriptional regulator [Methylocella sp. CPCC 101449]MDT2023815.1 LysR family transcriptional regulator [Methylocella sp. CPCC 101449]HEV2573643.1 LysR family transcriptional regulator [Beijerinckiaceae bacterium]